MPTIQTFPLKQIVLARTTEQIYTGSQSEFPAVAAALSVAGIQEIMVIGYKSQGRAQPLNFRDTLRAGGSSAQIRIGLRPGSASIAIAKADGFDVVDPSIGVTTADLVISLIADSAQVELYEDGFFDRMKYGATLGFSHGFLAKYLDVTGQEFPSHINVIGMCPKGMGDSVRRLYTQGSGINSSIAIGQWQGIYAMDVAVAWAVAVGSPVIFETTLLKEADSDIFGERGILLGALWAIVTELFRYYRDIGMSDSEAFRMAVESLTGPIRMTLSKQGLLGMYESLSSSDQPVFRDAYNRAYGPFRGLMEELYDEVRSGREIFRIIDAAKRNQKMGKIDTTPMWAKTGKTVRAGRRTCSPVSINPFTAGIFVAGMMAQIDVLRHFEHFWSEICNESIIEALDSLIPYMHAQGISNMVDNCSMTARRGTRMWGPRFMQMLCDEVLAVDPEGTVPDHFADFLVHDVHGALAECMTLRPPIDIAVE